MRRREFIKAVVSSTAAWPLGARAQQRARMRRIGVLLPAVPEDAEFQSWVGTFLQGLAQSGWITGWNTKIETRWTKFDAEDTRKYAAELVALHRTSSWRPAPHGGTVVATRTVFVHANPPARAPRRPLKEMEAAAEGLRACWRSPMPALFSVLKSPPVSSARC